ncbi:phenylalanine--tRNA ligase subunit beta [Synoicihabitans lomoniglobus]|uniref:Phenylalanine--tRNA ligase beta subunit n=1 Tax=Synoicihabitans lomoniglobus TaxID=2909285 RepID=A0AAF0CQ92_9BACT|nr:phenylalanine--tRNA ligase subunit beta [Opitutaceae bacterium LMO-M01]WED66051.1 phenylalanine--tRNA ligase subunit beta [Opitutaceae bacterium LMO-M01]
MKISKSWLQDYVDLNGLTDEQISEAITFLGFEVEGIEHTGAPQMTNVVVGEVLTRDQHPNADRLSICAVAVGEANGGTKRIVCGAQNYQVGDRVPVALIGAVLPGDFKIKPSKIRGEASEGMMCSGKELQIGDDHSGLMILTDRPEIGTPINDALPAGDVVFDIEITPNRPDCQSHLGVARELAAWFRLELRYPSTDLPAATTARPDLLKSLRVDAPEDCPLYTATAITGVKVGPSPAWMQQRLTAIGIRPINNLVDIGNYVMLEYGQPMHAFDARKLAGQSIVVRRATEGETLVTLDEKERTLTPDMLVIADVEKSIVVAGIMGGENSGVADDTTDLVLEVAAFRRQSVRATSRQLGLSSDSSYRFERGIDVHSIPEATRRALALVVKYAGGQICGETLRVGSDVPWEREITVAPSWVNARLGFEISDDDQRSALEALDLLIVREDEDDAGVNWTVRIPSWRTDLDRPIDLVEEILRVHGTAKIPAVTVTGPGLLMEDNPVAQYNRAASAYLIGQNFNECVTYTLRSKVDVTSWIGADATDPLGLANPFVEDQSHLRPSLIGGLLDSLRLNQARGNAVTGFFETGRVFIPNDKGVQECAAVGFIIAENATAAWTKREPADFYTAKRMVETLANQAGVDLSRQPHLATDDAAATGWQAGQHTLQGNMAYGWTARYGLLDLTHLKALDVSGKVYAGVFAILPERLGKGGKRSRFQPFSSQPAALRDVAVVVDETEAAGDVLKSLTKLARSATGKGFELEAVNLFDVYQGKGLPEGKKSLAFSLSFRAPDRTLKDDEVNKTFATVLEQIAAKTAYQVRS